MAPEVKLYCLAQTPHQDDGGSASTSFSAPAAGWLVLSDRMYPGWTAAVDGEARPIATANMMARAVAVGPGLRRVVFSFRARWFRLGLAISALSWLGAAA